MKERTSGDSGGVDSGLIVTRRYSRGGGQNTQTKGGMSARAKHTESEKRKENTLRIGRDALDYKVDLEYVDRPLLRDSSPQGDV
jgi:hypothetical protein